MWDCPVYRLTHARSQNQKRMRLELWLAGGLEHFLFSHILGMSSSQLTFIFFRGVAQPPTRWSWHWVCPQHLAGIVRIVPRVPNRDRTLRINQPWESFHIGFPSFVHRFLTYLPKTLRTQHHLLCGKKHCCGWTVLDHRIPRQSEAIRGNPIVAVVWDRHSHTRYRLADQDTLARGVRCHDPLGLLGSLMSVLLWRSVAPTGFIFVCCAQCFTTLLRHARQNVARAHWGRDSDTMLHLHSSSFWGCMELCRRIPNLGGWVWGDWEASTCGEYLLHLPGTLQGLTFVDQFNQGTAGAIAKQPAKPHVRVRF